MRCSIYHCHMISKNSVSPIGIKGNTFYVTIIDMSMYIHLAYLRVLNVIENRIKFMSSLGFTFTDEPQGAQNQFCVAKFKSIKLKVQTVYFNDLKTYLVFHKLI